MITEEDFHAYVKVQMSGVTNMWNVDLVMQISGLTESQCFDIMKNYSTYKDMYGVEER